MSDRYAVISIQHTGTHFLADMFVPQYHWASLVERDERPTIHVGHISPGQFPHILKLLDEIPVLIPVRHPYVVAESWKRKNKPIGELVIAYKLLNQIKDKTPYYLAVDSLEREQQLAEINCKLQLNLQTDWEPRNVKTNTYYLRPDELEPDPLILQVMDEMSEFFSLFY